MGQSDPSFLVNASSARQCSICLEAVVDNNGRSTARLQCGHVFHLDCIGSEFNVKNVMQCPNCRVTEEGEWLFAAGGFDQSIYNDDVDDDDFYYLEQPPDARWWNYNVFNGAPFPLGDMVAPPNRNIFTVSGRRDNGSRAAPGFAVPAYVHDIRLNQHNWNFPPAPFAPMSNTVSPVSSAHPVILGNGLSRPGNNGLPHGRAQVLQQQQLPNSPSPVVRASMLARQRRSTAGNHGVINAPGPSSSSSPLSLSLSLSLSPNYQSGGFTMVPILSEFIRDNGSSRVELPHTFGGHDHGNLQQEEADEAIPIENEKDDSSYFMYKFL